MLTGSPGTVTSSGGAITIFLHADAAVNGRGFELNWTCTYPAAAPVTLFEANDTLSCNGIINFMDLSSNGPTSWSWDFGDGNTSILQNPTHIYSNGGNYTVTLTTSNSFGSDTYSIQNYINIIDLNLSLIPDSACGPSALLLQANSNSSNIKWYSDPSGQNLISTGNTFTTPVLNSTTTYYAKNEISFSTINGAPVDNLFGSGSFYQGNRHLIFDNYYTSTLVSVLVYSNSDGYRTVELRNSSNAVLEDTVIFIPDAPNGVRIYLNFDLPVQNNMQLGVNGSNTDLFRNSDGAIFPYDISNIISITGTNASAGYYYFFYDWEILKESCSSNLISVDAIINDNYEIIQDIDLCNGGSVVVGNNIYNNTGNYIDSLLMQNGCDSIIYTNLTVGNSSVTNNTITICNGDQYIVGNSTYIQTGNYIDTLQSGNCDSIINTNLIVEPTITVNQNFLICPGDSILIGSNYYTNNGIYYDTLVSSSFCDSIIIFQISTHNNPLTFNYQSICQGDSYLINNNNYNLAGSYYDVFIDYLGCDSVVNTILTILPLNQYSQNIEICFGDSIQIGDSLYYDEGEYQDTLVNFFGCDSIISTYLTISDVLSQLTIVGSDIQSLALNGIPPYTYDLYGPMGLISSIQNNGSIFQFTPQINGVYYLIVTDDLNCISDTAFAYIDFVATSIHDHNNQNEIYKIVDVLGRETYFLENRVLFYIHKDGSVHRHIVVE